MSFYLNQVTWTTSKSSQRQSWTQEMLDTLQEDFRNDQLVGSYGKGYVGNISRLIQDYMLNQVICSNWAAV
jgi:hypothetical protein